MTGSTTRVWRAVDAHGRGLSTPRQTPAAALAASPVTPWPLAVLGDDGSRLGVAEALGPGGGRVVDMLDALFRSGDVDVGSLARATPVGTVGLPVVVVALPAAVVAAGRLDAGWLAQVDRRRADCRRAVVDAGREEELEAAVHLVTLVATERLDPTDDGDVDQHVASGAQLWLLAGAVASALVATRPDPFAAWADLVTGGWWPVGPVDGRLVVTRLRPR